MKAYIHLVINTSIRVFSIKKMDNGLVQVQLVYLKLDTYLIFGILISIYF